MIDSERAAGIPARPRAVCIATLWNRTGELQCGLANLGMNLEAIRSALAHENLDPGIIIRGSNALTCFTIFEYRLSNAN